MCSNVKVDNSTVYILSCNLEFLTQPIGENNIFYKRSNQHTLSSRLANCCAQLPFFPANHP